MGTIIWYEVVPMRDFLEIGLFLNRYFFMDLAAQLAPEFTTNAPDPTLPLLERHTFLEEENKLLNTKLEELRAVVWK